MKKTKVFIVLVSLVLYNCSQKSKTSKAEALEGKMQASMEINQGPVNFFRLAPVIEEIDNEIQKESEPLSLNLSLIHI